MARWIVFLSTALVITAAALAQPQGSTRLVDPPGEESQAVRAAIDQVSRALESGTPPSAILTDPKYLPLHAWPRFRLVIRDHAARGDLTIVTPMEPGPRLTLKGTVLDRSGNPVKGARVYVYQTSAKGWYSSEGGHIAGPSGDEGHARLFGYVVGDDQGRFVVKTIRPAGYPESNLPAHIHVEIAAGAGNGRVMVTEVQFSDDPRLTPGARRFSAQEKFVICDVRRGPQGEEEVEARFQTPW